MLLKKFLFLGLAALTAASPLLDARAGTKAVSGTGTKTGTKGTKNSATCPATQPLTAGVTCPRVKFTAAQINRAVKQAKAMKVKGKTGKGLHFPAKYKPAKEAKLKGKPKAGKSVKAGKTVKREDGEVVQVLEARRSRGGSTRTRTKPTKTTKKKTGTTKKKTPKKTKSTTGKKKKTTKKTKCKAGAAPAKVGKGVWMFPILEKGVWKPGAFPETNYIVLDSKFNYVKTAEREPGSAEEYEVCIENPQKKGTKGKGTKATKGKTA